MRVISGIYKRRQLATLPGNLITRPTADRIKESLFNIIASEIHNSNVLDLFSGSGSLGIEALSRGAHKVIFVEQHPDAVKVIQENLKKLQIPDDKFIIIKNDVSNFLKSFNFDIKIDIVFADPPYSTEWYKNALNEIEHSKILNNNCTVIFEMPANYDFHLQFYSRDWRMTDKRNYGKTKLEIWQKGTHE
ncbi:16S rRNA (guanine(966)-N(2))-methyltransferase RsmD [Spirobacillus cienkowskii]|jgi:16S rRNA (guanine966-N2)-methyltransferase|uniref:16S rRNA (Guanine(966)-N(2))-methyltransferase RsmD n=1 Tax=Spirobacillus cienkowskii TaxID=495820 RepID=A0A369KR73_9BACT|nr:MAG: 16S rRNA (guanine(966)-N(2))-methyltransferase RsmD [Spirobacillus cienkowskii]